MLKKELLILSFVLLCFFGAVKAQQTKSINVFFDTDQEDLPIESQIIAEENSIFQSSRLNHIIALLSKRQQEIIYLRFYQNLENDDISNIMGLGKQSVANLLYKTLKEIRQIWTPAEFSWALLLLAALA